MTKKLPTGLGRKVHKDSGASMVEYALLVALIALIAIAAITSLGVGMSDKYAGITHELSAPANGEICDSSNPNYPDC